MWHRNEAASRHGFLTRNERCRFAPPHEKICRAEGADDAETSYISADMTSLMHRAPRPAAPHFPQVF